MIAPDTYDKRAGGTTRMVMNMEAAAIVTAMKHGHINYRFGTQRDAPRLGE
jgi:hypothetical protein